MHLTSDTLDQRNGYFLTADKFRQPRRRARTRGELPGINRRTSCKLSVTVTVFLLLSRGCGRPWSDGVLVTLSWYIDDCMVLLLLPACR